MLSLRAPTDCWHDSASGCSDFPEVFVHAIALGDATIVIAMWVEAMPVAAICIDLATRTAKVMFYMTLVDAMRRKTRMRNGDDMPINATDWKVD